MRVISFSKWRILFPFLIGFFIGFWMLVTIYKCLSISSIDNAGSLQEVQTDFQQVSKNIWIQERLNNAESIWRTSVKVRHSTLKSIKLKDPESVVRGVMFWDYFYASFDCPFQVERIGRLGDGGKWVCGFEHLITRPPPPSPINLNHLNSNKMNNRNYPPCIVYSFGVAYEITFEEEILSRTTSFNNKILLCMIHMYDPTIDPTKIPHINKFLTKYEHTNLVKFHKIGIGASNDPKSPNIHTLSSLMNQNGHDWIDILKIDVEGPEFDVLEQIIQEFGVGNLPFGQLQIEIHLKAFNASNDEQFLTEFMTWFELLESAGLRPFHREINYVPLKFLTLFEYSFINVKNKRNPLLYA